MNAWIINPQPERMRLDWRSKQIDFGSQGSHEQFGVTISNLHAESLRLKSIGSKHLVTWPIFKAKQFVWMLTWLFRFDWESLSWIGVADFLQTINNYSGVFHTSSALNSRSKPSEAKQSQAKPSEAKRSDVLTTSPQCWYLVKDAMKQIC